MNILVPHSWLLDFIKTNVTPDKLAQTVSLCGPSFERLHKKGKETIYDIEITTNRPDTASVIGIARETATILPEFGIRAKFVDPFNTKPSFSAQKSSTLPIKIKASKDTVLRFSAIVIDNVEIKKSPLKIAKRLENVGIRPINNLVDLTNYIMTETGQPMHAFDYDSIVGQTASVELSRVGEKMTTLDGKEHSLPQGSIIIRDTKRIIDLAGIMGGENSQITSQTTRILLTSAVYSPKRIRSTSLKLAHRTQAATLFEKGIDPEQSIKVLDRSVKLLSKLSPKSRIASDLIDIYPTPSKAKTVSLSHELLEKYLGIEISPKTVVRILNGLQINTSYQKTTKKYLSTIPSHRLADMEIEQDLIEEIARIYGYHKLPSTLPPQLEKITPKQSQFVIEEIIKKILIKHEFNEVYNSPIISKELLEQTETQENKTVKITNPISENMYMRPSLLPSMSQTVELNLKYTPRFSLFELANIYIPQKLSPLPLEKMQFCLFTNTFSVSEFKGLIEQILTRLGIKFTISFDNQNSEFDTDQSVKYLSNKLELVTLGVVKKSHNLGFFAIIDTVNIIKIAKPKVSFTPIPTYPPTFEDITLETPIDTKVGQIVSKILKISPKITNISYIEGFTKKTKIAHTFKLELRDNKKTITKEEATEIKTKITNNFK